MTNFLLLFQDVLSGISSILTKWQDKYKDLEVQGGASAQRIDELIQQLQGLQNGIREEIGKKDATLHYEMQQFGQKKIELENKLRAEEAKVDALQLQRTQDASILADLRIQHEQALSREDALKDCERILLPDWLQSELGAVKGIMKDDMAKYEKFILAFSVYRYASLYEKPESSFWATVFRSLGQVVHSSEDHDFVEKMRAKINQENEGKFIIQEINPEEPLNMNSMNFPQGQGFQRVKKVLCWPVKRVPSGTMLFKADVEPA
jgi:chromosome segregation ATPase